MPELKRTNAHIVPCVVWLTVQFAGRTDSATRRLFTDRLHAFLAGTRIKPIVSPRLIGLHHPAGFDAFEISLITAWLSAQPEVWSYDFMQPIPSMLQKGARHGQAD